MNFLELDASKRKVTDALEVSFQGLTVGIVDVSELQSNSKARATINNLTANPKLGLLDPQPHFQLGTLTQRDRHFYEAAPKT